MQSQTKHNASRHVKLAIWLALIAGATIIGLYLCGWDDAARLGRPAPVAAAPPTEAPVVTISNPLPGQHILVDQHVLVISSAVDADGIDRSELWVDGVLTRIDVNPDRSSPYIVAQAWTSSVVGSHHIMVKAVDVYGNEGSSAPVIIDVMPRPSPTPRASATSTPMPMCTPPPCRPGQLFYCPDQCPGGCGVQCATPTSLPTAAVVATVVPVCTPPLCPAGQMLICPGDCPNACGLLCVPPPPTSTPAPFPPTGIEVHVTLRSTWSKPGVKEYLGTPLTPPSADRNYARQYFERGYLYWWDRPDGPGLIWVVEIPNPALSYGYGWRGPYEDTWKSGDDPISCEAARHTPYGPQRGFGRLWCTHPEVAQIIGNARTPEAGTGDSEYKTVIQLFQGGLMFYSPLDGEIYVLFNSGMWQRYVY